MTKLNSLFSSSDRTSLHHDVVVQAGEVKEAISYMQKPGRIDLSALKFEALENEDSDSSAEKDASQIEQEHSFVDILVFPLPRWCSLHQELCDLSQLGIGQMEEYDGAKFLSLCQDGKIRVDASFMGYHTGIKVPTTGTMDKHVKHDLVHFEHGGRSDYDVMIANCNRTGRNIIVTGQVLFDMTPQNPSMAAATDNVPVPYSLVSVLVFLFFALCSVRIRCGTIHEYEVVSHDEASDAVVATI